MSADPNDVIAPYAVPRKPIAVRGKKGVVGLVDEQNRAKPCRRLPDRRQHGRTRVDPREDLRPHGAQARLAPGPQTRAEVDPSLSDADQVVGDLVVTDERAARLLADQPVGRDEPRPRLGQRLIELGGDVRVLADLRLGQPLPAQAVDPGLPILDEHIERVVALEVAGETQAEAQVVAPPRLSPSARSPSRAGRCPPRRSGS